MIAVNVALLQNRTTKMRNNLKPAETTCLKPAKSPRN